MIKLLDLLSESRTRSLRNTQNFIKRLGSTSFSQAASLDLNGRKRLYRAMRRNKGEVAFVNPSTKERKSRDTNNFYTVLLDNLPSWSKFPKRSRSVICLLSGEREDDAISLISDYGDYYYKILPKNNAKFAVASKSDLFSGFPFLYDELGIAIDDFSGLADAFKRYFWVRREFYESKQIDVDELVNLNFDSETILKFLEILENTMDMSDFKEYLNTGTYNVRLLGKLVAVYQGSWLQTFDYLLNPKSNNIYLMSTEELYNTHLNNVEVWTDSPCLFLKTGYAYNYSDDQI